MEKDYNNLKEKTVFDFCDDEQLLYEIVGESTKEEYIKHTFLEDKYIDLSELGSRPGYEALATAVTEQLQEYIDAYFNE